MSDSAESAATTAWRVECGCGFEGLFLNENDARAVFDAHAVGFDLPLCSDTQLTTERVFEQGGIEAKETLPYDVDVDPAGLTDPAGPGGERGD